MGLSIPNLMPASQVLAMDQAPVVLDASLTLAADRPSGKARFEASHLPGAQFFDLNEICEPNAAFPRMLPSPAGLAKALQDLGIGPQDPVLVYDQDGIYSAPRVWWMLRCLGHGPVAVLDGGLAAWERAGGSLSSGMQHISRNPAVYPDRTYPQERYANHVDVHKALQDPQSVVVDARSRARFEGRAPERSPKLACGHMPGAQSLPYSELLTPEGCLGSRTQLLTKLETLIGSTPPQDLNWLSSCGSGVTACVLALAMEHHLSIKVRVYDASWSEWGQGEVGEIVRGA